jgi:SAM-dependent methyltransferase
MAYTNELLSLLTRVRPFIRVEEMIPESNDLLKPHVNDQMEFEDIDGKMATIPVDSALEKDPYPLPTTRLREGYTPKSSFLYWWTGYADYLRLRQVVERYYKGSGGPAVYFDFGCASGRLLRHFAAQTDWTLMGCDIDLLNVRWMQQHLAKHIQVFQNTSLPHLPIEDNSVDVVSAYSVFSHIDLWEEAWLLELRRVLRPGGLAFITFQSQHTWNRVAQRREKPDRLLSMEVSPQIELTAESFQRPMPHERIIFFMKQYELYVNTYLTTDYVQREWSRFFDVCAILPAPKERFQEGAVLRKRAGAS